MMTFDYYQDITGMEEVFAKTWESGRESDAKIQRLVNVKKMIFQNAEATLTVIAENGTFKYSGECVVVEFGFFLKDGSWCAIPSVDAMLPCVDGSRYYLKDVINDNEPDFNTHWKRADAYIFNKDGKPEKIDFEEFVDKQTMIVENEEESWELTDNVYPEPVMLKELEKRKGQHRELGFYDIFNYDKPIMCLWDDETAYINKPEQMDIYENCIIVWDNCRCYQFPSYVQFCNKDGDTLDWVDFGCRTKNGGFLRLDDGALCNVETLERKEPYYIDENGNKHDFNLGGWMRGNGAIYIVRKADNPNGFTEEIFNLPDLFVEDTGEKKQSVESKIAQFLSENETFAWGLGADLIDEPALRKEVVLSGSLKPIKEWVRTRRDYDMDDNERRATRSLVEDFVTNLIKNGDISEDEEEEMCERLYKAVKDNNKYDIAEGMVASNPDEIMYCSPLYLKCFGMSKEAREKVRSMVRGLTENGKMIVAFKSNVKDFITPSDCNCVLIDGTIMVGRMSDKGFLPQALVLDKVTMALNPRDIELSDGCDFAEELQFLLEDKDKVSTKPTTFPEVIRLYA